MRYCTLLFHSEVSSQLLGKKGVQKSTSLQYICTYVFETLSCNFLHTIAGIGSGSVWRVSWSTLTNPGPLGYILFSNLIILQGGCCNVLQNLNWLVVVLDYLAVHVAQVFHRVHLLVWIAWVMYYTQLEGLWYKRSLRPAGKIYLFYSPSQEGVQYFYSQERVTRIFPRKDVFAWPKKEGVGIYFHCQEGQQDFFPEIVFSPGQKREGKKPMISRTHKQKLLLTIPCLEHQKLVLYDPYRTGGVSLQWISDTSWTCCSTPSQTLQGVSPDKLKLSGRSRGKKKQINFN